MMPSYHEFVNRNQNVAESEASKIQLSVGWKNMAEFEESELSSGVGVLFPKHTRKTETGYSVQGASNLSLTQRQM